MDSLVVVKEGMATRYCIQEQLKQLEDDIRVAHLTTIMSDCIETDKAFNDFLNEDPFANLNNFFKQYEQSWLGELLGFYIGNYSNDQQVIELSNKLRGVHNAQHRVADKFIPLLLEHLSNKFFISNKLARFMAPNEITKDNIQLEVLKQRQDYYILATIGSEIFILSGNDIEKEVEEITAEENTQINNEIKGQISFPGKISGQAKIVNTTEDMAKVNEGDILVSIMTRTNFISAMQKAAAFVTDEGGITCHAAIVARELKKPCIVGTKNATKLIKDGDLIEVDADRGVVIKLNQ